MAGHHRNKDDSCVLGGDRTGVIFFSPGFSPLCVSWSPAVCPSQPIRRLAGTSFYRRDRIDHGATQQTSKLYHGMYVAERSTNVCALGLSGAIFHW